MITIPLTAIKVTLVVVLLLHGRSVTRDFGPYHSLKECVVATEKYVAIAKKLHVKVLDTECEWTQKF